MSSGDTARQAPDVEGLLRAWLQTQERGLHLLRADDFQGVCDGHLVEARLKAAKALTQEINHPAPPRERRGAAGRSNRFLRGASPNTGRARLEIARRRREVGVCVFTLGSSDEEEVEEEVEEEEEEEEVEEEEVEEKEVEEEDL